MVVFRVSSQTLLLLLLKSEASLHLKQERRRRRKENFGRSICHFNETHVACGGQLCFPAQYRFIHLSDGSSEENIANFLGSTLKSHISSLLRFHCARCLQARRLQKIKV